jgi:hypothetical protein
MTKIIPQKPVNIPDNKQVEILRQAVHDKIAYADSVRSKNRWSWPEFSFITPKPIFQFGFATLLILIGFLLGNHGPFNQQKSQPLSSAVALQPVQYANGSSSPYLEQIRKVRYDVESNSVEILFNTVNDVQISGNLQDPEIQSMLSRAMTVAMNPAVRLHATKAMNAFAATQTLPASVQLDLAQRLRSETNQGIRLKILETLRRQKLSQEAQHLVWRVFRHDDDAAIRMAAFQCLVVNDLPETEYTSLLTLAQRDTNQYIRNQADDLLDLQPSTQTYDIKREN